MVAPLPALEVEALAVIRSGAGPDDGVTSNRATGIGGGMSVTPPPDWGLWAPLAIQEPMITTSTRQAMMRPTLTRRLRRVDRVGPTLCERRRRGGHGAVDLVPEIGVKLDAEVAIQHLGHEILQAIES